MYGILFLGSIIFFLRTLTLASGVTNLLFLLLLFFLLQLPSVQTWLTQQVARKLSVSLGTTVSVHQVEFSFFDRMTLRDVLIEDHQKDTLLYAGGVKIQISDWFINRSQKIRLQYISLNDAVVKLQRTDSVWNYQFLSDFFSGPEKGSGKGIELDLKKVLLSNIRLLKRDAWRGEDFNVSLASLQLDAEEISFSKKTATINTAQFARPRFAIINYTGRRPPPDTTATVFVNDPLHLRLNPADWKINARSVTITDGAFQDFKADGMQPSKYFDGTHILFDAVQASFNNVALRKDTVTAQIELATKERSGFEVKKLTAWIRFFPEAMEFHKLDIQTPKSHIRKFYAMRFRTFDDMSDYETKINMEGDFADSEVDSDDIGFFAPALKPWNKRIRLTGIIKGTVDNLKGSKMIIVAGKNTLLDGDIYLKGLPDIDRTFIEFRSNDFRTSYADASLIVPVLKDIQQPRIDRITDFRFKGTFTGYLKNFVTNGTIETNLGGVVADVHMKFPDNQPTIYSGDISTTDLDLGQFVDNDNIGKVAFSGKITGTGLASATLNATLDGTISSLDFSHYTYHGIFVNGAVAKKKFNGQLISKDSNLDARLLGLIDFSQQQPKFDFDAEIGKTDLKKLHLTRDTIDFSGKLRFNFTGSNIDNIIGTARVYDASIYKNRQRISFDSLTLESSLMGDNNKSITVASNEFDAAIVGEFSIKDLPQAFQAFLNRYYPSYIKPVKNKPSDEDFSFVINTKKIDDYISFIDKNLGGFNNTVITSRINTKKNLLDVNAEVPEFSYKKLSFINTSVKGGGTLDSLSLETNIGDVAVNDSLHFPKTHMTLRSSSDRSDVRISTSASQTLNSANVDAQVQTSLNEVAIKFNPSTFDVNGKKWVIQKNGELSLGRDIITASALNIYSDDQQIQVTTHPSISGNWNDVHIDLKKINIGDFTSYFVKSDRFEGLLSGSAEITNPLGKTAALNFTGRADQFRLNNDSVGKLDISGGYQESTGMVTGHVNSDNRNYHFDLKGVFNLMDSTGATTPPIDLRTSFTDTKVDLLEKYLGAIFSNVKGFASGKLQISGPGNQLRYIGDVDLRDAQLRVNYTQCTYKIAAAKVMLRDGYIDFGSVQIKDSLGNTGEVTHGRLMHHSFSDLAYDFALSTNKLLVLNTRASDNNQFYGKVIGKATLTLKGPNDNMLMEIKGQPADSSNIFLPLNTGRESADADFLVWKVYGTEMQKQSDQKETNLTVKLDLTANNYVNVYVIVDPLTGDIMKANGHGNLQMRIGTTENLSMSGRYEIDKGSYNFTFQSFIRKPFIFREGGDNYIQWRGNPYDAEINVEAVYEAENISFNDLAYNTSATGKAFNNDAELSGFRGPVLVIADLTQKLMHPHIEFKIELPQNSPLKNDQYATWLLDIIQADQNELNKQVSFLLVFNSFGPMSNTNSAFDPGTAVTGIFVNSISGFISNQLTQQFSNIFQRIFNNKNLRLNLNTNFYNGSAYLAGNIDESKLIYDRTSVNLSLAQSFLNQRLTFTFGSALDFGLSAQQAAASSFQFLPDLTMEYKLTPDGRLAVSLFYRDSYNYLSTANRTANRSGTSLSYSRSFDRIDELFKKKKKKDKDKPKEIPLPAAAAAVPAIQ